MLKGILDANITNNIVRLGSRFAVDERLASFSLDEAEKVQTKSRLDRSIGIAYREMKATETEMAGLMKKITSRRIPQEHMEECILSGYPWHYEELFRNVPHWVSTLIAQADEDQEGWETVGQAQKDFSTIDFWAAGRDLQFLEPPKVDPGKGKKKQKPAAPNRFEAFADDDSPTGTVDTSISLRPSSNALI